MSDLLNNARQSIVAGVNDYMSDDDGRLLSAARNVHAGVLLLFKEKLRRLSPSDSNEVLVKQNVIPVLDDAGNLSFKGTGKNTADVTTIKRRFKSLGINAPWKRFDRFNKERNNIEHYYTRAGRATTEALLADACVIVEEFIREAFADDLADVLDHSTWDALRRLAESARQRRQDYLASIKHMNGLHPVLLEIAADLRCEECGTPHLRVVKERRLICDLCSDPQKALTVGFDLTNEDVVEQAALEHFSYLRYRAARMKCGEPLYQCPNCDRETLLSEGLVCLACGYQHDPPSCILCESVIDLEELHCAPLCGYCHSMTSRAD